jgi:ADP-ribosylglycohydrolase
VPIKIMQPVISDLARYLNQVAEVARASSLLTHGHAVAIEGAAAGAILVAMALRGATPEEMFTEIDRRCAANCAEFASVWRKLPDLISQPADVVLVKGEESDGRGRTIPWRCAC